MVVSLSSIKDSMTRFVLVLLLVAAASPVSAQLLRRGGNYSPPFPVTKAASPTKAKPASAPAAPPVAEVILPVEAESQVEIADPPQKDVPNIAEWEIIRRGHMVEPLGTPQAGDASQVAEALAVPADDSYKWFITLVTTDGCRACERLKYDFINSKDLQAWVLVDDPVKSTCHYQVRRIEDVTQKDWFAGIQTELRRGGFPAVVIQPPRNGQYGPNKTVVTILHGYNGNSRQFGDRMSDAIKKYVAALHRQGVIRPSNSQQTLRPASEVVIGGMGQVVVPKSGGLQGPPPFVVPPQRPVEPPPAGPPGGDWPPNVSTTLTLDQIKEIVPTATPDFLLSQVNAKPTDKSVVDLAWQVYKNEHGIKDPTPAVPNANAVSFWTALALFLGSSVPGLLSLGLHYLRDQRKSQGKATYLSDDQFNRLTTLLNQIPVTQKPTTP
jgi:hypothetical protein